MSIPQTSYTQNMALGFEGMLGDHDPDGIRTCKNSESSAEIAFGRAVKLGTLTGVTGQDPLPVLLPAAESDAVFGIVIHSHAHAKPSQVGDTGLKVGEVFDVLVEGSILVVCEDGCSAGDRLWVRAVGSTPPEYLGGLNNADDSTDMIDCTKQGQWMTGAAAGGLAWLKVNFTAKP